MSEQASTIDFQFSPSQILDAAKVAAGASCKVPNHPFSSPLFISVSEGAFSFSGSDPQFQLTASATASNPNTSFTTVVDAKKLTSILSLANQDAMVSARKSGDQIYLVSGKSRFKLNCLNETSDFQHIQVDRHQEASSSLTMKQVDLYNMLAAVHDSAPKHDVRYFLLGVRFEIDGGVLSTVASNGHILTVTEIGVEFDGAYSAIIPSGCVQQLLKTLDKDGDEVVSITCSGSWMEFEFKSYQLTTKLISGAFPAWRRVVPPSPKNAYTIEVDQIKQALARVKANTEDRHKAVAARFSVLDSVLSITDVNEEFSDQIEIAGEGAEPIEGAWNILYLLEMFTSAPEAVVRASKQPAQGAPLLVEAPNFYKYRAVAMPMRI